MAESPLIEHHRPVPYRLADCGTPPGFTVTASTDGRQFEVSGICPGCGGRTSTVWEYGTAGFKNWPRRSRPSAAISRPTGPQTVTCECGHVHPDRPESAWDQGCGAFWQVELE